MRRFPGAWLILTIAIAGVALWWGINREGWLHNIGAIPSSLGFAQCILKQMPGAANDIAALAIEEACLSKHPGGLESVRQGSGRGFFGYESGNECTAHKARDTRSDLAAVLIQDSCEQLYDGRDLFREFGIEPP